MYTTKYDIIQHCVQYGNLFLDLNEIKRTDIKNKIKTVSFVFLSIGQFHKVECIFSGFFFVLSSRLALKLGPLT